MANTRTRLAIAMTTGPTGTRRTSLNVWARILPLVPQRLGVQEPDLFGEPGDSGSG